MFGQLTSFYWNVQWVYIFEESGYKTYYHNIIMDPSKDNLGGNDIVIYKRVMANKAYATSSNLKS